MTASTEITSRVETITPDMGDVGIRRFAEGLRSTLDMACIRNEGAQA